MTKKVLRKKLSLVMSIILMLTFISQIGVVSASAASTPRIIYCACLKNIGWQGWVWDGQTAGTTGESKALEGVSIYVENPGISGSVQYRTYNQGFGWLGWRQNGQLSNGDLNGARVDAQAIQIKLTGQLAQTYDVVYRAHSAYYGWLEWVRNGQTAGRFEEGLRIEAIEVKLVEKSTIRALSIGNFNGRDEVFMAQFFASLGVRPSYYTGISKSGVTNAIKQTFAGAKASDISYLYLSTHGATNGYIAIGTDGGYSMTELKSILDQIPGTFVIMLNSCYSGNFVESGVFNTSGLLGSSKYKILTSSSSTQMSGGYDISISTDFWAYGSGYSYYKAGRMTFGDNSTFDSRANSLTNRFLNKLPADANGDGYVTLKEITNFSNTRSNEQYGSSYTICSYPSNSDFVMFTLPTVNNFNANWY